MRPRAAWFELLALSDETEETKAAFFQPPDSKGSPVNNRIDRYPTALLAVVKVGPECIGAL